MKNDIDQIINFLREAKKLQAVYRFSPKLDGGFENDAEHSWSVALICMLVGSRVEHELGVHIDHSKMLKMALVHDLAEIGTGDTATWDKKARINKEERERVVMKKLVSVLPKDLSKEIMDIWEEVEKKESIEAKIVKSVDRFEPVIQRTIFNLGWDNVSKSKERIGLLDKRQLDKHGFSDFLTTIYRTMRSEAKDKGMFKE